MHKDGIGAIQISQRLKIARSTVIRF
ncbi:hypothetical protein P3666_23465 [Vibrio parahaemolyticus]|nr:hypothetical protein [Vibrio parahaemolyticus]MCZ5870396.1 hypothetical protein [Vibrio parahaemolyticus]MCZ5900738.1 hypothetical protein [Vibrio parahaemolyticus]MCZ6023476.1 hypothetical protein [Vibrio parahaemolyticus]MCZ6309036.1 hypothetical protein [Vibrio parahaemolyticus]MDF4340671.1 hypothetical protein [Vibrio parahaemolyticus]